VELVNRREFGNVAELKKKPAHLAVFVQYVLSSQHDPAPLVICICCCRTCQTQSSYTEQFQLSKTFECYKLPERGHLIS